MLLTHPASIASPYSRLPGELDHGEFIDPGRAITEGSFPCFPLPVRKKAGITRGREALPLHQRGQGHNSAEGIFHNFNITPVAPSRAALSEARLLHSYQPPALGEAWATQRTMAFPATLFISQSLPQSAIRNKQRRRKHKERRIPPAFLNTR
jgi:hypothetical protein